MEETNENKLKFSSSTLLRYACKLCKARFESEIKLLVHFEAEHLQNGETLNFNSDCEENDRMESDSSDEDESDLGDFLTDVEKQFLESSSNSNGDVVPEQGTSEVCDPSRSDDGSEVMEVEKTKKSRREGLFSCGTCPKTYAIFKRLKEHVSREKHKLPEKMDMKPYACTLCDKSYTKSTDLKRHMENHPETDITTPDGKTIRCLYCTKIFTMADEVSRHVIRHHPGKVEKYKCENCEKTFVSWRSFKIHQLAHEGKLPDEKPAFSCETCQQGFVVIAGLRKHLLKTGHTTNLDKINKRPYQCLVCNSGWATKYDLRRHEILHRDKEKPSFQCHVCTMELARMDKLISHIRSQHPGRELPQCKVCKKVFATPDNLIQHVKTHAVNYKLHPCTLCEKGFPNGYALTRHMIVVHREQKSSTKNNNPDSEDSD